MPEDAARRVLIVNPGSDVYGSDLQLLESISAMVDVGWDVALIVPADGPLIDKARARGARVRAMTYPVVRRAYLSAGGLVRLGAECARALRPMTRAIREEDPDVVYVNTTTIPWWIAAARLVRTPVVCHVHEAEVDETPAVLKALTAPQILANRLILNSHVTLDTTVSAFSRLAARSTVVHNGLPDRPTPPVEPPDVTDGFRLCVVARLSPRKALDVAVSAIEILRRDGRDVRLELAGSSFPGYEWFVDRLREQITTAGLDEYVELPGYVTPVYDVFDRSHIVLEPTWRESFGNTVVEAQLSERPVVAAAAGGHLESIVDGETGLLVPPKEPVALAASIVRLMDDEGLRQRLSTQARVSALERFGVAAYGSGIRDVMERQFRRPRRLAPSGPLLER